MANAGDLVTQALRVGEGRKFKAYERRVDAINAIEREMELLAGEELRREADALRKRASSGESLDNLLPEAFALTREASRRALGQRHYDVQLIGGMVLHDGAIAEMKTGEGKTLTATLAVFLNTLAGNSVHVVTVNDYLARRDAEWMKPIYEMLGVSVATVLGDDEGATRQRKYPCDVVYGTNSQFGFDYLRDNMAVSLAHCVQRGHHFAIVDEVDNVLIDEARTPLIISGAPEQASDVYSGFARLAEQMEGVQSKDKLRSLGESRDTSEANYDYEYDEKRKTVSPTERGVTRAEEFLGIDHLYRAEHGTLVNHLIQALKAVSLYGRDKDYAVIDGKVLIIDQSTGRLLEGRRWSEGLHQAIEAKEGVAICEENQTVATITLQNYFRLYEKLSGMTGTALTEATEFMKTYKVPVVEIPTHRPVVRRDLDDLLYKTKARKWKTVRDEISRRHEHGQPILVGTVSVETSEMLSEELKHCGIEHTVLNAKPEHAQREGEIIAQAGRKGAVMIATNMAGRGVDIKLGGDPEQLAKHELKKEGITPDSPDYEGALKVKLAELEPQSETEAQEVRELGGLFVCGTERHESRRIDNQLRGRSGRQGDPGETQFFLSAEDDVIRLYSGERMYKVLDRFGSVNAEGEEVPLGSKSITKLIESAQEIVEERNFLTRKRVLEYDDVLNEQRRVIYKYRRQILEGRDMSEIAHEKINGVIERLVDKYTSGDELEDWNLPELERQLRQLWPMSVTVATLNPATADREKLTESLNADAMSVYERREQQWGETATRGMERALLMNIIDRHWSEHLSNMQYLRQGIHLRGMVGLDPLAAYKNEGFSIFEDLMLRSMWEEFTSIVFRIRQLDDDAPHNGPPPGGVVQGEHEKTGRNDPCWCGSGTKYKKCHGA